MKGSPMNSSHRLAELIEQVELDPSRLKDLEAEVERMASQRQLGALYEMLNQRDQKLSFYMLIVLEKMIKTANPNNAAEIGAFVRFLEECMKWQEMDSATERKMAMLYATLGVYAWPNNFPTFFNVVIELAVSGRSVGFLILENFLHCVRSSVDISEGRRAELKRAMVLVGDAIIDLLRSNKHVGQTILIYTHLISILPRPINFSLVLTEGANFPERTIDFFIEATHAGYSGPEFVKNIVDFCARIQPIYPKMIECFLMHKSQVSDKSNSGMYSYVFDVMRSIPSILPLALAFWNTLFRTAEEDGFFTEWCIRVVEEVVKEASSENPGRVTQMCNEDLEGEVSSFLALVAANFPMSVALILDRASTGAMFLPRRYATILVRGHRDRAVLNLRDVYLHTYSLYLENDPRCIECASSLDPNDRDSCRLLALILKKFSINERILPLLFEKFRSSPYSSEAIVHMVVQTNDISMLREIMGGQMDVKKAHCLFYIMKTDFRLATPYIQQFLDFVITHPYPFDRYFAILGMIYASFGSLPPAVLESIFVRIDSMNISDVACLCGDMLVKMYDNDEIITQFLQKIFFRLNSEWENADNQVPVCAAIRSFLFVIEGLIIRNRGSHKEVYYSNIMIEMLQLHDPSVFRQIHLFYSKTHFAFDVERFAYFLLTCYNSPHLLDQQSMIVGMIIDCIKTPNGPDAFSKFNIDRKELEDLRKMVSGGETKSARSVARKLLAEIKGKPLSTLYKPTPRIESQRLFAKGG